MNTIRCHREIKQEFINLARKTGIFLGCELVAGIIWKGDFLIADLEDLENWMQQTSIFEEATREEY